MPLFPLFQMSAFPRVRSSTWSEDDACHSIYFPFTVSMYQGHDPSLLPSLRNANNNEGV
jgi:hypothetical protein